MNSIGFDLGTKCGWSALSAGRWNCGLVKLPPGRFPGDGLRPLRFEEAVLQLFETFKPDHVYYELVRAHIGVDAAHVYGSLRGTLTKLCEQRGIKYTGIPVGTVKKHATGHGGAKKPAMIAAARATWPHLTIPDDNVADALWVNATGIATNP